MVDIAAFRVRNDTVWRQIKYLLLGSATLFLINIYFGFDNALTEGVIPRWQLLIHLHAGSIGWITLSVIAMAIWIFSGESFSAASTSRFITPFLRWLDPDISYQAILRTRFYIRKAAHLTEYAVLAVLAFRALRLSLDVSTPREMREAIHQALLAIARHASDDDQRDGRLSYLFDEP